MSLAFVTFAFVNQRPPMVKDLGATPSRHVGFGGLVDIFQSDVGFQKKRGRSKSGDSRGSLVVDVYVCLEVELPRIAQERLW